MRAREEAKKAERRAAKRAALEQEADGAAQPVGD